MLLRHSMIYRCVLVEDMIAFSAFSAEKRIRGG